MCTLCHHALDRPKPMCSPSSQPIAPICRPRQLTLADSKRAGGRQTALNSPVRPTADRWRRLENGSTGDGLKRGTGTDAGDEPLDALDIENSRCSSRARSFGALHQLGPCPSAYSRTRFAGLPPSSRAAPPSDWRQAQPFGAVAVRNGGHLETSPRHVQGKDNLTPKPSASSPSC